MCGRFARAKSAEDAKTRFHADRVVSEGVTGNNISPTNQVTVVRPDPKTGERVVDGIGWSFKFPGKSFPNINAKSETALERVWKQDALTRRLIIPAEAFYEWQLDPEGGKLKIRWNAVLGDRDTLALAGIAHKTGEGLRVLILTQPAQEDTKWIHDRQPLILPESLWDDWLDPEAKTIEHVAPLLAPTDPPLVWEKGLLPV